MPTLKAKLIFCNTDEITGALTWEEVRTRFSTEDPAVETMNREDTLSFILAERPKLEERSWFATHVFLLEWKVLLNATPIIPNDPGGREPAGFT